jgi:hypothetical protein
VRTSAKARRLVMVLSSLCCVRLVSSVSMECGNARESASLFLLLLPLADVYSWLVGSVVGELPSAKRHLSIKIVVHFLR